MPEVAERKAQRERQTDTSKTSTSKTENSKTEISKIPEEKPKIEVAAKNSSSRENVEISRNPRPKIASSQNFGRCEEFRNLVEKYNWNAEKMLAIMRAESGCNPKSDNTGLNADGTNDKGLFQINSIHGFSDAERLDPERNVEIAFKIWQAQGYEAWSAHNNGSYLKYLK